MKEFKAKAISGFIFGLVIGIYIVVFLATNPFKPDTEDVASCMQDKLGGEAYIHRTSMGDEIYNSHQDNVHWDEDEGFSGPVSLIEKVKDCD